MPGPDQLHAPDATSGHPDRPLLDLGPAICADDVESRAREWLLTNGRGSYACGSVAGTLDRRYHAFLAAAVDPPDTRHVLLAKLDERLVSFWNDDTRSATDPAPDENASKGDCGLTSEVWASTGLAGFGHRHLVRCRVADGTVEHTWLVGRTRLTRRLVMPHGLDVVVAEYRVDATDRPIELAVKAIGSNRLADTLAPGSDWTPTTVRQGVDERRLELPVGSGDPGSTPLAIRISGGAFHESSADDPHPWYRGYRLETEARRGYDDLDDHLLLAEIRADLRAGDVLRIEVAAVGSVDADLRADDPFENERRRHADLLAAAGADADGVAPLRRVLVAEADRFVVTRPLPKDRHDESGEGASIIAGYPWFADWGRDTMIALPGLCLATGRADIAREILSTFARFERDGLLPNRFPGAGSPPEYNTADASLLFVEAVGRTWRAGRIEDSNPFLESVLPTVDRILDAPVEGTLHGIRIDPEDGLLTQGEDGLQLTWMDARIGGEVVTPRRGKAVELNGLLHSALRWRALFATALGMDGRPFDARADRITSSFERFWMPDHGYLADVIDGPHGLDGSLRPNQLLATGSAHPPVTGERAASVLGTCERSLLVPVGLRSLDPADTRYQPRYEGDQASRDAAYHMGTSWPWLIGPYLRTHRRVHDDPAAIAGILAAFTPEVSRRGLHGVAEVHDGDAPHRAGGCLSQAWSVGELLAGFELARPGPLGESAFA